MKQELIKKLKEIGVVERGKFVLKSGIESDFYVDIKKAYGSPELLDLMAEMLIKDIDDNVSCVAGQGCGGIALASLISVKKGLKLVLVRDKVKDHGKNTLIEGYVPNENDKVWIVDDVLTRGTAIRIIESSVRETGAKILGAGVVLKRGDAEFAFPLKYLVELNELIE